MFYRYVQDDGNKEEEEDVNDIVVCEHCIENNVAHCEVKLSHSSPTNAINHLRIHHRNIYEKLMKEIDEGNSYDNSSKTIVHTNYMYSLCKLIVHKDLPLGIVEDQLWRDFTVALNENVDFIDKKMLIDELTKFKMKLVDMKNSK